MAFLGLDIKFPTWTRNKNGQNFSDITSFEAWSSIGGNLDVSLKHPILTPALLFVSKLFSQATFKIIRDSTGAEIKTSPYLKLINNPNANQTRQDLLEALLFTQIANGVGVLYTKRNILTEVVNSIYVLDFNLIKFPEELKKNIFINASQAEKYLEKEVIYDENGENLKIKLKDLMFFYDLPNVGSKNPFKAESRITGLRQTLINTQDSLIAKNIILKSNGKELISTVKDGFPLTPEEKEEIENNYQQNYGVSFERKRGMVVSASVNHKSLHIALRDLGLDESVKTDGNIVFTALHIPKDIVSLEAKKTTYNNFKESMASYVQNEMQSTLNSFCAVVNKVLIEDGITIEGSYEHLPIMQFILIERYKGVYERGNALYMLRASGIPDDEALRMVGMDSTIILGPLVSRTSNKPIEEEGVTPAQEDKIKQLINELL
jgi:hypothetical protein